jgi:glycerophosphoryl diester phosphodiesterase
MRAFQHAVDLGFAHIETDAHVTADGVVIAFHDSVLDRVTDRQGAIASLPWSTVAEARIAGEPPVLLADLLTTFPDVRFNIDPKHDAVVEPLARLLDDLDAVERVGVGSFSGRRLARLRALCGPRLVTSVGPAQLLRLRYLPGTRSPASCVQVPERWGRLQLVEPGFVARCHRRGMQVHVWTVDDADEMHRLLDLGVDGLITDRPSVLKQVLVDREAWFPRG